MPSSSKASDRKQSFAKASARKLAAILFADIEGYTALMQKNEKEARRTLDKFKDTLNQKVVQFNGRIVNDLGDGCLCTFDSAVDAVHCAMQSQQVFLATPTVPVRMGLHSGDVFFKADNVYGDSVNIASRIESLGVAGSVLFSKRIRQHIDNQPEFEIKDLGEFDFKNVDKTMKVYALANQGLVIPAKNQMNGKIKKLSRLSPYLVAFIAIAIALGIYASAKWQSKSTGTILSSEIRNERIAVIPIKNKTNETELDILGDMAADWINRGLMEVKDTEVVSPYTVQQHEKSVGILPNNQSNEASFYELTGARNFIDGNFYKEGDDLIFHLSLVDAIDGKMIFNFPEIRGSNDEREEIITQLREKIMGYWAAKDLVNMKKIKTPDYRAYQLYLEFLKSTDDQSKLAEILEIDSLFFLPRIQFLNINRPGLQGDMFFGNTIHFDFLERHRDQLSDYETKWLDYLKNMYLGNPLKTFESINALRLKYPKDFAVNHETAVVAHEGLNNPELASEIYDELQITEDHRQHVGVLFNWRLTHRVITANKSHDPETIQTRMNSVVPDDNVQFYVLFSKLIGSSLVNDQKTFDAILSHMIDADKEIDGYKIYDQKTLIKKLMGIKFISQIYSIRMFSKEVNAIRSYPRSGQLWTILTKKNNSERCLRISLILSRRETRRLILIV